MGIKPVGGIGDGLPSMARACILFQLFKISQVLVKSKPAWGFNPEWHFAQLFFNIVATSVKLLPFGIVSTLTSFEVSHPLLSFTISKWFPIDKFSNIGFDWKFPWSNL